MVYSYLGMYSVLCTLYPGPAEDLQTLSSSFIISPPSFNHSPTLDLSLGCALYQGHAVEQECRILCSIVWHMHIVPVYIAWTAGNPKCGGNWDRT